MCKRILMIATMALGPMFALAPRAHANDIARFQDPLPGGGGETMFLWGLSGFRLYGGVTCLTAACL
jgi:hypothetical protein